MIGLALITGVMVLAQSLQVSFDKILEDSVAADLFIYEENQGLPFAATALDQLAATDEIDDVAAVAPVKVFYGNERNATVNAAGFDTATEDRVLNIQLTSGSYQTGSTGVLLFDEKADELGLAIGDRATFEFEDAFASDFEIVGLFSDKTLVSADWVFDRSVTAAHSEIDSVGWIGATFADGVEPESGQLVAQQAVANFPQLTVQDNTEFKETQAGQINQILYLIFALLFLCILVAFIGIVNTMALSILERTKEIGLVRAVGMSRKQLRTTVRWEAIIVGVFGALLGVILGIIIGYAAVVAIPDSFISEVSIPWLWAIIFTIIGGLLGMFAAVFPARRAANMNVLEAISSY